jgi:hypothetical protein
MDYSPPESQTQEKPCFSSDMALCRTAYSDFFATRNTSSIVVTPSITF